MSFTKEKKQQINQAIVEKVFLNSLNIKQIAQELNISRQTISKYKAQLIKDKILKVNSNNELEPVYKSITQKYKNTDLKCKEDSIWVSTFSPFISDTTDKCKSSLSYVFCEMLNNAIEHSNGSLIEIELLYNPYLIGVYIKDNGIGIFKKIQTTLNLPEKRYALLELAKGKFTSAPEEHSGEGIFFSSKMANYFAIISDELTFTNSATADDKSMLFEEDENIEKGTLVYFVFLPYSVINKSEIFEKYTQYPDDFGFTKTLVPVKLLHLIY